MQNIFEALRADHERQRRLLDALLDTTGGDGDRRELFEELTAELQAHAMAEERHFYVPLMGDDLTQEKARHSVAEHKELDDFVEQLEGYDLAAPQWLITAEEMAHRLRHHLEEEEREVFQMAGKVLSDDQKTSLASAYENEMNEARSAVS
ncbi:MAG: hemerythrin domain-containing protein [Acidimicrobiales bacterium]